MPREHEEPIRARVKTNSLRVVEHHRCWPSFVRQKDEAAEERVEDATGQREELLVLRVAKISVARLGTLDAPFDTRAAHAAARNDQTAKSLDGSVEG